MITLLKGGLLAAALVLSGPLPPASASDMPKAEAVSAGTSVWEPPYIGSDPTVLYLPDVYATYWRYGWVRSEGDAGGIVITGTFPDARYFSFNVYDDDTKSSLGALTDFQLVPDGGDKNPVTDLQSEPAPVTYTLHVLPQGTETDAQNALFFPPSLRNVSVFLRHYLPHGGIEGGVALPLIESFDPATGVAAAPASTKIPALSKQEAKTYLLPMLKDLAREFETEPDAVIAKLHDMRQQPLDMKALIATRLLSQTFTHNARGATQYSYRYLTSGTYPNEDNLYLGLPVVRKTGEALVARFRAPTFPGKGDGLTTAQTRYFSLNQGDAHSYTTTGMSDAEMVVAADGMVTFIIGDAGQGLEAVARRWGANFMPWKTGNEMLLIQRHMLPAADFDGGIDKVPPFEPDKPAQPQNATRIIGDYAITGKLFTTADLLAAPSAPRF